MSSFKKPRLSEEEQALQDQRNREIRERRMANLLPPKPPSRMSSRRTSPAQSPQASSSSSANMVEEDDKCVLCLNSLKEKDIYTTHCGHSYHEDCYHKLQTQHCPMCRASLAAEGQRPADSSSFEQLVTPDSDYQSDDETEMDRVLRYIATIRDNRLRLLAAQIFRMRNNVTEQQLRFMIFAATDREDFTAEDLLEGFDGHSDFGSVSSRSSRASSGYSRNSPVGSISSRNSPVGSISSRTSRGSISSRNSNGSISSRTSRGSISSRTSRGSISSRTSNGSTTSLKIPYYFSSDDDDDLYPFHPISSNMASNSNSSSSSILPPNPPPTSSSSSSNINIEQKSKAKKTKKAKAKKTVRNPSPPVSIPVDDNGEWIQKLYREQNIGEKRKRGGKSKRKNNKKTSPSRKTLRSR